MASLGKIAGKMLNRVAPIVDQNWRDKVDQMADDRLRQYQSNERQLDRDQREEFHDETMAYNRERGAASDAGSAERLRLSEELQRSQIARIDQEMEARQLDIDARERVEGLKQEFLNADPADTEKMAGITRRLQAEGIDIGGTESGAPDKDQIHKITDPNTGEDILVRVAPGSNVAQRLMELGPGEIPGADGNPYGIKEINGLREQYLADPSEGSKKQIIEMLGHQAYDTYFSDLEKTSSEPASQEAAPAPAAASARSEQQQEPAGNVFDPNKYASSGDAPSYMEQARDMQLGLAGRRARETVENRPVRDAERATSRAVKYVEKAISKGEWPNKSTPEGRLQIETAIASGKLDPQLKADLEAYLNQ